MAENQAGPLADTKVPGNIVSRERPVPAQFPYQSTAEAVVEETQSATETQIENNSAAATTEAPTLPEITDDQLKELLKSKGIDLGETGIEGLKEKIQPPTSTKDPALVAKEKEAADAAFEKRMLDYFIENGGTAEQFVQLKQLAQSDLKVLSESEIRREMKDAGFETDDINAIIKERYYQLNPEEILQGEDETEEDFAKRKALVEKKIALGSKKFESKASHIKKNAEEALNTLREIINTKDTQAQKEAQHSQRVTEFFSTMPRKITVDLGKTENGLEIGQMELDVPEEVITEVMSILSDSAKRQQFLFTEDDGPNLDNLATALVRNKILESALQKSYLSGGKKQVEEFEKKFPGRTAKDIGIGGVNNGVQGAGRKGHIVSKGAPVPASPKR